MPETFIYTSRFGHERQGPLWLVPEIDCEPMVDDYCDEPGEVQFRRWVDYLKRGYPDALADDAIPISWSVMPACETAPFQLRYQLRYPLWKDFLDFYSWPVNAKTGERLDWFALEVRHDRFPEFSAALNWRPSPLQSACPLRSILASRAGQRLMVAEAS